MSVIVRNVQKGSPAARAGLRPGDELLAVNGREIIDVLDYRYALLEEKLCIAFRRGGKEKTVRLRKGEYDELGLEFDTYLMDGQRSCKNKCIFCFIDQMPPGLRDSLYFKDDDDRLSFLFGNYITMTNLTEREVERIIELHLSPINVSVHTTNPALRVRMMKNKHAGEVLAYLPRFAEAGLKLNCQLVLCPGFNDGEELSLHPARFVAALSGGAVGGRCAGGVDQVPRRVGRDFAFFSPRGGGCDRTYGSLWRRFFARARHPAVLSRRRILSQGRARAAAQRFLRGIRSARKRGGHVVAAARRLPRPAIPS